MVHIFLVSHALPRKLRWQAKGMTESLAAIGLPSAVFSVWPSPSWRARQGVFCSKGEFP